MLMKLPIRLRRIPGFSLATTGHLFIFGLLILIGFWPAACGKGSEKSGTETKDKEKPLFDYKDEASNLQSLMEQILLAPPKAPLDEVKKQIALARALVPDEPALAMAFKPGAIEPNFRMRFDAFRQLAVDDLKALRLFLPPDRAMTRVTVHTALVNEISQGKLDGETEHGKAFDGTSVAVPRFLKPDLRVHQVVLSDPKTENSHVLHLFFWDGAQWKSLGPFWADHRMRRFLGQDSLLFPGK